ncbi:MAG: hypothetical protein K0U74_05095 [Alphaproteobacteria bacterium]|nr:hypothetical protein [Alphaproteobacteria bacterium]
MVDNSAEAKKRGSTDWRKVVKGKKKGSQLDSTESKVCLIGKDVADKWLNKNEITKAFKDAAEDFWDGIDKIPDTMFSDYAGKTKAQRRASFKADYTLYIGKIYGIAETAANENSVPCNQCELLDDWGYLGSKTIEPNQDPFQIEAIRKSLKASSGAGPEGTNIGVSIGKIWDEEDTGKVVKLKLVSKEGMGLVHDQIERLKLVSGKLATTNRDYSDLAYQFCDEPTAAACAGIVDAKCELKGPDEKPYGYASTNCTKYHLLDDLEATWKKIVDTLHPHTNVADDKKVSSLVNWMNTPIENQQVCPSSKFLNVGSHGLITSSPD